VGSLAEAQSRPNIVLILGDNLGYEEIDIYGSQTYSTPNINRLAREGMRFTNMIALPLCIPSRLMLETGRYLHRATQASVRLANMLQNAGYTTLFAGKWHLERWWRHREAGFSRFLSLIRNNDPRYFGPRLTDNGQIVQFAASQFGPDIIRERVIDYMEQNRTRRFFIAWYMFINHRPSVVVPGAPASGNRAQRHREMMAYADREIGIFMNNLRRLGLANNTVVIFLTDGGSESRGGSVPVRTPQGTVQVRGGFGFPTDAGTRVPFIVRWPGVVPAGRTNQFATDITAILPTLAAIAGANTPSGVQGENLLQKLRGNGTAGRNWAYQWYDPDPVQSSSFGNEASEFVRGPRYKLYRFWRCGGEAFFDLANDLNEENPIPRSETTPAERAEWDRLAAVFAQTKPGAPVRPSSCS
jgi:arylsulfatase A